MQAALGIFLQEGYRVSMDRVAERAGVAKQTLYAHFGCKEKLFAEVVQYSSRSLAMSLDDSGENLRPVLLRFARVLRARLLSAEGIGLHRMLVAESPRFPKLAELFYRMGPEATRARLADFLDRAMITGQLRAGDPGFAADMLLGMLTGNERVQQLYGVCPAYDPDQDLETTTQIVDCFLRAYHPD